VGRAVRCDGGGGGTAASPDGGLIGAVAAEHRVEVRVLVCRGGSRELW
jgi:hypothetical protein